MSGEAPTNGEFSTQDLVFSGSLSFTFSVLISTPPTSFSLSSTSLPWALETLLVQTDVQTRASQTYCLEMQMPHPRPWSRNVLASPG